MVTEISRLVIPGRSNSFSTIDKLQRRVAPPHTASQPPGGWKLDKRAEEEI